MNRVAEPGQASIGELLKGLLQQVGELIQNEIALARTELAEKMALAGRRAAGAAVGVGVLLLAALALLQAVIGGTTVLLALVLPTSVAAWLGPLLVAGALGAFGWLKLQRGLRSIKGEGLTPHETIESLQETKRWIGAKAS